MPELIEIDGLSADLEVVDDVVVVIETAEQGPAGPVGSTILLVDAIPDDAVVGEVYHLITTGEELPPIIGTIADQNFLNSEGVAAFPFAINDFHDVNSVDFTALSSNTTLLPSTSVVIIENGVAPTLGILPLSGSGMALVTVVARNYLGLTAQTSFTARAGSQYFTITTSAGANGSITPTNNLALQGSTYIVTATPDPGYYVETLIVDTVSMAGLEEWTFNNISADHSVSVVFAVNTAPTISAIDDLATDYETATSAIPFTIGDAETAAADLTVSAVSSNQTLLPDDSCVFGGSGTDRTITCTPASGQSGTATVTVTVSDGNLTTDEEFILTVNPDLNVYINWPATTPNVTGSVKIAENATSEQAIAQSFVLPVGATTIDGVDLYVRSREGISSAGISANMLVGIYSDSGGLPSTLLGSYQTILDFDSSELYVVKSVEFGLSGLTEGTKYHVVIKPDGFIAAGKVVYYTFGGMTGDTYAAGSAETKIGTGAWSEATGADHNVKVRCS